MARFSNKKIIHVMYFATSCDRGGGSFHSLFDLTSRLKNESKIVPFVVLPGNGSAEKMLQEIGIEYRVFRSFGSEWPLNGKKTFRNRLSHFKQRIENFMSIQRAVKWAKGLHLDLIHINTSLNEIGYYVARRLRIPFVWHIREFPKEGLGVEFYNEKRVLRCMGKASAIITVSSALKQRYSSLLPSANIKLIYNGIDGQRFFFRRDYSTQKTPIRISAIGRISRLKGHFDLVEAFRILKTKTDAPVELFFAGPYGEELEQIVASYGLSDSVHFLGVLEKPECLLAMTDIYVSGHPWEGFGRSSAEAMLAGCCLIGVNNAGTHELLQDGKNGYCFTPGDPQKLCSVLLYAIKNREKTIELAKRGQQFAKENFLVGDYCHKVWSLYCNLLAQSVGRRQTSNGPLHREIH